MHALYNASQQLNIIDTILIIFRFHDQFSQ